MRVCEQSVILGRMGRPAIVLDDLREKRIVDAVRAGLSVHAQAARGGISPSLLKEWLAAGRAGDERFVAFLAKVESAKADREAHLLSVIENAFGEDPVKSAQHALALLKVRFPHTYSDKTLAAVEEIAKMSGTEEDDLEVARSVVRALESKRSA